MLTKALKPLQVKINVFKVTNFVHIFTEDSQF